MALLSPENKHGLLFKASWMSDFWVYGYGSLMWRPGFEFVEQAPALLKGLHRSLCVYSHVHRGTPECPGLVLGLDLGGSCQGLAFRVNYALYERTLAYLRAREQATMVYRETERLVDLVDGSRRRVRALCYVVDRAHPQYAGTLPVESQVEFVRRGAGLSGINVDYVMNTLRHLREMGIRDHRLEAVAHGLETGRLDKGTLLPESGVGESRSPRDRANSSGRQDAATRR